MDPRVKPEGDMSVSKMKRSDELYASFVMLGLDPSIH